MPELIEAHFELTSVGRCYLVGALGLMWYKWTIDQAYIYACASEYSKKCLHFSYSNKQNIILNFRTFTPKIEVINASLLQNIF